ncbi:MAG: hypothetical protein QW228_05680 [Candidatus Aenigmatarchaeota archaeon]
MNRKKLLKEYIENEEKELFYDEISLAWLEKLKEEKEKEQLILKGQNWQKELTEKAREKERIRQMIEGMIAQIEAKKKFIEFLKEKEKEVK